jgi:hypothetical protein
VYTNIEHIRCQYFGNYNPIHEDALWSPGPQPLLGGDGGDPVSLVRQLESLNPYHVHDVTMLVDRMVETGMFN